MLTMAVGHTDEFDTVAAAEDLLVQCQAHLGDAVPDAALLFVSHDVVAAALAEEIQRAYPGLPLIGGTTLAPLTSEASYSEGATSLALFAAPTLRFATGSGVGASTDAGAAARQAVLQARERLEGELSLCIVITRIDDVRGFAVNKALREVLGPACPVFGGGALGDVSDKAIWNGSLQISGGRVMEDAVVVLLVSGPLSVSIGIAHGWHPVGRGGVITKADGNVVHTIDGQPVQEFYRRYLKGNSEFPLAIPLALIDPDTGRSMLRGVIDYESEGPVEFLDAMPEGAKVSVAMATTEDVLSGAAAAVEDARQRWLGEQPPQAALAVCCAARNVLLGARVPEELDAIRQALPDGMPLAGAYVGGEIGANGGAPSLGFYGHTCVTLLLGA
jgi:hypothetical protein